MALISKLRALLPEVVDIQMQADGYCLWFTWNGESNSVLLQTLEDYGGVLVAEEGNQAIWFFFSADVFLAVARLSVWSRFNPLQVLMQVFPGRIKVESSQKQTLIFDEALWQQDIAASSGFQAWAHSATHQVAIAQPGISFNDKIPRDTQFCDGDWKYLDFDARLPYPSSLGWYAIMCPVGNAVDKAFQAGWRDFFSHVESLLQRNKFRFMVHNNFVMFPLDTLRQCKSWVSEILSLIARLSIEQPDHYWPSVFAIVERKGLNFGSDLPGKIHLDWSQVSPGFPHVSKRTAVMLGSDFSSHEVFFIKSQQSPDDWCSVSLQQEAIPASKAIRLLTPPVLTSGVFPHCFYCGQRSHAVHDCPTRLLPLPDMDVWKKVAELDYSAMVEASDAMGSRLEVNNPETFQHVFAEESVQGLLLRATYAVLWRIQPRAMAVFWRMRNKDLVKGMQTLLPKDTNPIWGILESFGKKEPAEIEKELSMLSAKFPQDFRIASLRGFLALEQGNNAKAASLWKDAEVYSPYPVMQAWHLYLQARVMECIQDFAQAQLLYDNVLRICPQWSFIEYRKLSCDVKRGFAEQALPALTALIDKNGDFFNRVLVDPELERGHIQIFTHMQNLWFAMEARAEVEVKRLLMIQDDLGSWFMEDNKFAVTISAEINKYLSLGSIKNYVAFLTIVQGRMRVELEIQAYVSKKSREFKDYFSSFADRVKVIREESAWFPFPRLFSDFVKNCNKSIANCNWGIQSTFSSAETFKKAQFIIEEEKERLSKLEGRLKFLRIIRDVTIFILSFLEAFLWMEFIGIIVIFILLPLILIYGDKIGLDFASSVISRERWQVQKALFILVSIIAFGLSSLRTVFRFERIRDKIFAKAKLMREGKLVRKR